MTFSRDGNNSAGTANNLAGTVRMVARPARKDLRKSVPVFIKNVVSLTHTRKNSIFSKLLFVCRN